MTYSKLGNALVYVCDCRKMTDTCRKIWEKAGRDLCISPEPIPREWYEESEKQNGISKIDIEKSILTEVDYVFRRT